METTTLITNGRVRCLDSARTVYDPGFVLVSGAAISAVGSMDTAPSHRDVDHTIDAAGCLVMPGFINMHHHHWYVLLKGQGLGMYLEDWLSELLFPAVAALTRDQALAAMRLAAAEMLLSGTTTFFNHSVTDTSVEFVDALGEVSEETGVRQVFGKEVRAVPADEAADVERELGQLLARHPLDGRLFSVALVVETGAHWIEQGITDEVVLRRAHELSRRYEVPVSDHITGGTIFRSVTDGRRRTGMGDAERLAVAGVLDGRSLLVHGVWLTAAETLMAAEAGAHLVTCPASSAFTAGGAPPLRDFIAAGLNVCLGTDGPMVNDTVDMLEQLRASMRLENVRYLLPNALTADQLVSMATRNGAEALGLGDRLGHLSEGAVADIVIFDQGGAHLGGLLDPDRVWLTAGSGRDVKWVLVNGDVVVSPAGLETMNVDEVVAEARVAAEELWEVCPLIARDSRAIDSQRRHMTINLTRKGPRRWHDQRWLVDIAIRTDGLEWDQPRIAYTAKPIGVDANHDFEWVRQQVRKFADITPAFSAAAQRRENSARKAESDGRTVAAREHYFIAALLWASAEWPIWETTTLLVELDDRKNECYERYAKHADHHVERVDLPFESGTLPAWFHLPPGWDGKPLPTALVCGGMDAPKELNVAMYGDKLLQRGFAVLSVDGPGQGEAPIRGVPMRSTNWVDAGEVWMNHLRSRPEVDAERIVAFGLSFGSFWMTQVAATQPSLRGCAVGLVCHEPGGHTIFEEASPTFKARFMWMADIDDEKTFDEFAQTLDLRGVVERMEVPWLVLAGEEDELSPIEYSYDLAARAGGPASLLVYEAERHAFSGTPSTVHGPNWNTYAYDWLVDRVSGVPAEDVFEWVSPNGTVQRRPHPRTWNNKESL